MNAGIKKNAKQDGSTWRGTLIPPDYTIVTRPLPVYHNFLFPLPLSVKKTLP